VPEEKEDAAGCREAIEFGFKSEDRLSKVVSKDAVRRVPCALVVLTALVCCVGANAATSADAVGLAGGGDHSCVLRSSGHVDCWGWNQYAQLGDGTNASSSVPVEVQGVSDATQLAAGGDDSCVVLPTGHIDCWGWNGFGQLGDGAEENGPVEPGVSTPVEVLDVSDATQVAVGDHSCAVLSTGHIDCWGENYYGALGNGKEVRSDTPVEVRGIADAVQVTVADEGSCALLSNGHVDCWGQNEYGQLGDGNTTHSPVPVEVQGVSNATEVATGGSYSCAMLSSGHIDCWGADYYGQLGDGAEENSSSTPVEVQGISDATQVAAGEGVREHACALLSSGHIDCWGRGESGQLGDDTTASSSTPVEVQGVADAIDVTAGRHYSCALLSSGRVECWGGSEFGQLGNGTMGDSSTPVEVVGISSATQVTAGDYSSCVTLSSGHVDCSGQDEYGQLGDGSDGNRDTPVEVLGISDAAQAAGGGEHACALLSEGHIDCWGNNRTGQLGNGTTSSSSTPVEVLGISAATQVAAGESHSCALLSTDHVDCWGNNRFGDLGNGSETDSDTPVQVQGISSATQVVAGNYHSCALLSGGHVDCWGNDEAGQLGNGSEANNSTPVEARGVVNAIQVTAGYYQSCALLSTGHIDCWGDNGHGELGDGSEEDSDVPVEVRGVSNAIEVTAGSGQSCALLSTGHVTCWGDNSWGDLGNGSEEGSDVPVEVQAVSNATEVVAGNGYSCVLLPTGHVDCWGRNYSGELGDGLAFSEVPGEVVGLDPEELSGSGPGSPSAVTSGASSVTQSSATLEGSVNPNGNVIASWCRFEYGSSVAYGSSAACPATLTGGSSSEDVSSSLAGLSVGTSYHYRLVAVNAAGGISYGADKTFKTKLSLSVSGPLGGAFAGSPIPASSISATVTAGSALTGTITFTVFGPQSSPPSSCTLGGATVGTASVSGGGTYQPSAGFTPSSPGDYWWYASYGGEPATSTCGVGMAETTVASKAIPILSVSGPMGGVAGSPISASSISATLAGGSAPTGTITFTVFGPQSSPPSSCMSGGTTVGTASVNGNGAYQPSAAFTPAAPGEYWWYASYGGDAGDEPAASTCGPLMAQALVAAAPTTPPSSDSGSSGSGPGGGSGSGVKTPAPALSGVELGSKSSNAKKAIALKLTLSQPATIEVLIAQVVKAHKLRGVCKPQAKKGKSCTTTVEKRTLTFSGSVGSNALALDIAGLGKGSYTATITVKNANGQSSTVELAFTVTHREAEHAATMRPRVKRWRRHHPGAQLPANLCAGCRPAYDDARTERPANPAALHRV
jgi:alpha-tubulin suppressor-like RCC1 family protein